MYNNIYIDANIWLDYLDNTRVNHTYSKESIDYCLNQNIQLLSSCDIVTTLYYINSKFHKKNALSNIEKINAICTVIDFSNHEVSLTCKLMHKDADYDNLEDTLQYILAQKEQCDLIISNDKNFTSKELTLMSSENFVKEIIHA